MPISNDIKELVLHIEQIMLMQDKSVRLENAGTEIELYVQKRIDTLLKREWKK